MKILATILLLVAIIPPALAGVTPAIVGDADTDTIYVTFAVNDTLGNAADCDSAWAVRFYNGRAFDSAKVMSSHGSRTGLYAVSFRGSADVDSLGAYWVQVRTYGVSGRNPHITYSYTVVDGGPVGRNNEMGISSQAVTDIWNKNVAGYGGSPTVMGGALVNTFARTDSNVVRRAVDSAIVLDVDGARDATKSDYQSTTGPGPTPVRLLVLDDADTGSIEGVHLTVKLAADQTKKHECITGADGWASMTLNDVGYDIYATANNYQFTTPAIGIAVSGDSLRDTIWATVFDPGSPVDPELCRVYGWVYDLTGTAIEGVTIATRMISVPVRYADIVVSPFEKSTTSDSTGYWYLDVYPSAALTPGGAKYEMTLRYDDGAIVRKKITVPDTTSWQFSW